MSYEEEDTCEAYKEEDYRLMLMALACHASYEGFPKNISPSLLSYEGFPRVSLGFP